MKSSDSHIVHHYYRPQTKLREGNVFTPVCDSVYRGESLSGGSLSKGGLPCPKGGSLSKEEGLCLGGVFVQRGQASLSGGVAVSVQGDAPCTVRTGGINPTGMVSCAHIFSKKLAKIFQINPLTRYVSLRLRVQNAVPAQPCVRKLGISLVLLNFLHCNFRLWFKTP